MVTEPAGRNVWWVRLAALAALGVGSSLTVPGVDRLALDALRQQGGASLPEFLRTSLFGVALMPLLVVSLVLAMLQSDPEAAVMRRRLAAVVYLGWCAVSAWSQFALLFSYGRVATPFSVLVVRDDSPSWLPVLSWVAGAAVLWVIAEWVTRRGQIFGAVLLVGALAVVADVEALRRAWHLGLMGERTFSPLFHSLPWAVAVVALWLFTPTQWPVPLPSGLQLRSRLEAVLFPIAVGHLAGFVSEVGSLLLACAAAVLMAASLRSVPHRRGSVALVLLALLVPWVGLAVSVGPMLADFNAASRPFAGPNTWEVVLSCPGADAALVEHDRVTLTQRLERLRVRAALRTEGPGRLGLQLQQVNSAEEVLGVVTPPYRLRFLLVARDQSLLSPERLDWQAAGLATDSDYDGTSIIGPTPESFASLLEGLEVPDGQQLLFECRDRKGQKACSARLLETAGALEGDRVSEARVVRTDYDGRPSVSVQFDKEGAGRLADLTSEPGRDLAIVLDDRILSAPRINERIVRGQAMVTLGRAVDLKRQVAEAERLVVGLDSKALRCAWQVDAVTPAP